MRLLDGHVIYSATDLIAYLECDHLVTLERDVVLGGKNHPPKDPTVALIAKKGDEHERRYLDDLERRSGRAAYVVATPTDTLEHVEAASRETIAAMERGEPIIYQGVFFDGEFVGKSDFLRRVERPCERWAHSYEVVDTKLALSEKPYFIIQLSEYSRQLAAIQGTSPLRMHIVLGNGDERSFDVEAYAAYYRHLKQAFLARDASAATQPIPVNHCDVCVWDDACERERIRQDHLSQVALIRSDTIERLKAANLPTMTALAQADTRPLNVRDETFERLRRQARMQVEGKRLGRPRYEVLAQEPHRGFARLPEPNEGDLFFDFEGDPLYEIGEGLEYLFGIWCPGESPEYVHYWAGDRVEERAAVEAFIAFLVERREKYPDAHFYHYAPYEPTALQRVTYRHGTRADDVTDLLRCEAFVDLYPIVRQSVVISQPSYSIKKLEAFYDFRRTADVKKGDDSIVQFESWLLDGDPATREAIVSYNAEDCHSTKLLHDWLLARRDEYARERGEPAIPFRASQVFRAPKKPHHEPRDPACPTCKKQLSELREQDRQSEIERRLFARTGDPDAQLLGVLAGYHHRESLPQWWEFHRRCADADQLAEFDDKALGGVILRRDVPPIEPKKSNELKTYTYEFPEQDYDLEGDVAEPDTRDKCGTIVSIDPDARLVRLKVVRAIEDPAAIRALVPTPPGVGWRGLAAAVADVATLYLDGTLAQRFPATNDLLHAATPRRTGHAIGDRLQPQTVDASSIGAVVRSLDASYLFVQGPPGSGKTYTGARVIVDLIAAGKTVAVMARSHKVVHNLLREIEAVGFERGIAREALRGVHKSTKSTRDSEFDSRLDVPYVTNCSKADDIFAVAPPYDLVSGTNHLFVAEAAVDRFDYLFIDEAGQMSLADALGTSRVARNVVLLGDPMQLGQVTQGSHALGGDRSVLQHVLRSHATVPEDRGILLDVSYRMQPEICAFVSQTTYEGRLRPAPATFDNGVEAAAYAGAGLRFIPVAHTGRVRDSEEEARAVRAAVADLMCGSVRVNGRPWRAMTEADIVVVTPYNAQRKRILDELVAEGFAGVRVGTVDKFQGQEAPVVIYSMATSSADDVPRSRSFLYQANRFNVAVSRGQCLSILVCSPKLLDARCNHVQEMALVNQLCRFVECAREVPFGVSFAVGRTAPPRIVA